MTDLELILVPANMLMDLPRCIFCDGVHLVHINEKSYYCSSCESMPKKDDCHEFGSWNKHYGIVDHSCDFCQKEVRLSGLTALESRANSPKIFKKICRECYGEQFFNKEFFVWTIDLEDLFDEMLEDSYDAKFFLMDGKWYKMTDGDWKRTTKFGVKSWK